MNPPVADKNMPRRRHALARADSYEVEADAVGASGVDGRWPLRKFGDHGRRSLRHQRGYGQPATVTDTEGTTFEEALRQLDDAFQDVPKRPFGTRFARSVRCGRSWTSWTRSESRSTFRSNRAAPARSPSG